MNSSVVGAPLSGARKAAVLTLLLGEEQSAAIFKHLREDEIERITKEVAAIGSVQPELGEKVLQEFHLLSKAAGYLTLPRIPSSALATNSNAINASGENELVSPRARSVEKPNRW